MPFAAIVAILAAVLFCVSAAANEREPRPHCPRMDYPRISDLFRTSPVGSVIVLLQVAKDGHVEDAAVARSGGHPRLDRARPPTDSNGADSRGGTKRAWCVSAGHGTRKSRRHMSFLRRTQRNDHRYSTRPGSPAGL